MAPTPARRFIPDGTKTSSADVAFRPAPGAAVSVTGEIQANGSHFELRHMSVHQVNFPISANDVTLRNVVIHGVGMQGASSATSSPAASDGYHSHLQNAGSTPPRNIL